MGKTIHVYRVENPDTGTGPFQSYRDGFYRFSFYRGHRPDVLPNPYSDGIDDMLSHEVCATRSLAQLRKWFWAGHLRELHHAGYVVKKYAAPKEQVRFGGHQVVVSRNALTHVETFACADVI